MKRVFDISLALILIIFFGFFALIIAILIRLSSKDSILYWSSRVGINNQLFRMPKFRSMNESTPDLASHLIEDPKKHLTYFGAFLRNSSLDEIPQLYSIIKGDMSFVGPRPALYNQYDLIDLRTDKGIHKLKPGLTGWAQVNGRDELSLTEKTLLDAEYLKKKSFLFDLKILWMTVLKVMHSKGISH